VRDAKTLIGLLWLRSFVLRPGGPA
jgi:hypothetical protein